MDDVLNSRDVVLEALLERPRSKPELVEELNVSRSTVDRAITELLESACIDKTGSSYRATETGRLGYQVRQNYLDDVEILQRAAPILRLLPRGSVDMEVLREAEIDLPTEAAPWKAFEESRRLAHESTSIRGTAPAVFGQFFDDFERSIENGGFRPELVLDADLFAAMDEADRDRLEAVLEPDGGCVLTAQLDDPFAIWIVEGGSLSEPAAGLTVYSNGGVVGVIRTSDPDGVEWIRAKYDRRRERAEKVLDFS